VLTQTPEVIASRPWPIATTWGVLEEEEEEEEEEKDGRTKSALDGHAIYPFAI
jgi:hypothetical protein